MSERHLVLGLDMGIASCGYALLDTANQEILEMGSRLFPEATFKKSGAKISYASVRREKRSMRRNLDRTQDRMSHLRRLLSEYGVVPEGSAGQWFKMDKGDERPILLRRDGLDRGLDDREWAIVLYHLCVRRGYIPHGVGRGGDADEIGKVLKALTANASKYGSGSSYRTVGEWMASLGPQGRNRNHGGSYDLCVAHAALMEEARLLFAAQREFGNDHASKEMEDAYIDICDWERDGSARDEASYGLVGYCTYFRDQKRAARSTLSNELLSARAALCNIRLTDLHGATRALSRDEMEAAMAELFPATPLKGKGKSMPKGGHLTYSSLKRLLGIGGGESFNVSQTEEKVVYDPKAWRSIRYALRDDPRLIERLRGDIDLADAVAEAATYASSAPVFRARLRELDLSHDEVDTLLLLPFEGTVFKGYGKRSAKAVRMLLSAMEDPDALDLSAAEEATGLKAFVEAGPDIVRGRKLPAYESYLHAVGDVNSNPVVLRAVSQTRKVVNAITSKWGVPHEVHIELARELRLPKRVQAEIHQANNRREDKRASAREKIAEYGIPEDKVKGILLDKYLRHEQQGGFDPYTGEKIEIERLIFDENYCQIDHILPLSRTGDNSRSNKVLCLASSNQAKRQRTPYEWMTSGEDGAPRWDDFATRVVKGRYKGRQRRNLLMKELDEKEFINRNLTDTAYMTRAMCAYIGDCLDFPEGASKRPVVPVSGQGTGWLRAQWGLGFGAMGEKDRKDPRHHAVDACIIAACDRGTVIRTAKLSKMRGSLSQAEWAETLRSRLPWPSFADDVRARYPDVPISRFVQRKGSGAAFMETTYRVTGTDKNGKVECETRTGKAVRPIGNPRFVEGGKSVQAMGDMACLCLWRDADTGEWYAEPRYFSDIPAVVSGTHVPKAAKCHSSRDKWQEVPEAVYRNGRPITLFRGDILEIDGKQFVYESFDVNSAGWTLEPLNDDNEIKVPTIRRDLKKAKSVKVIRRGIIA